MFFAFACNPIPQKDAHPEVPLLTELLKDQQKFTMVTDMKDISDIIFLKNDRLFLQPNRSDLPFKIIDVNQHTIFEEVFDWEAPFFIDKSGNLYFNRKKYFYPDYRRSQDFKNIVFTDSIRQYHDGLNMENDSLAQIATDKYEEQLLKKYGYKPCKYDDKHPEQCEIFEVKDETLFVRRDYLFKSQFSNTAKDVKEFDDRVLTRWANGKIPYPVYMYYYKLGDLKFKVENGYHPSVIKIAGSKYLYTPDLGLFRIKEDWQAYTQVETAFKAWFKLNLNQAF